MKILLGIQPTGRLHIGNYFGALKKGLEMQKEHEVRVMVARFHANTKWEISEKFASDLMDLGFTSVWLQEVSSLSKFYELAHSTSYSELARLPQYQQSLDDPKKHTLHMLSYPLLMAADIIVSGADAVIVGDDQEPHMHFYREIARRHGYKEAITIKSDTPRIMSIKDPSKKMSKSLGDEHCIYLDDNEYEIGIKIMGSPTTPEGITNLKLISKLYGFDFDENNCKASKQILIDCIRNYNYSIGHKN